MTYHSFFLRVAFQTTSWRPNPFAPLWEGHLYSVGKNDHQTRAAYGFSFVHRRFLEPPKQLPFYFVAISNRISTVEGISITIDSCPRELSYYY